jgi:hypothetical protein
MGLVSMDAVSVTISRSKDDIGASGDGGTGTITNSLDSSA